MRLFGGLSLNLTIPLLVWTQESTEHPSPSAAPAQDTRRLQLLAPRPERKRDSALRRRRAALEPAARLRPGGGGGGALCRRQGGGRASGGGGVGCSSLQ